jgi:predicted alpha/beta hydrolase family esterase
MKNALILHGTANTSQGNWFPWLTKELERRGYKVWSPDLPDAENPDDQRYSAYIFGGKHWQFNSETIIVGHSSGGVAALKLLQHLPDEIVVNTCITVGAFVKTHGWDDIKGLFVPPFDYEKIKSHAKHFVVYHSDNDKYVPLSDAQYLEKALDAELIVINGQGHFNLEEGEKYKKFPELLEKIVA